MLTRPSWRAAAVARFGRAVASSAQFINRKKELEVLTTRIRENGNFFNVQGPPDCGKSALVAHALDQLEVIGKPATSVVRVDLRVNSFNNVAGFTATLSRLFAPVHRRWMEAGGKNIQAAAKNVLGLPAVSSDTSASTGLGAAAVATGVTGHALENWGHFESMPTLITLLDAVFQTTRNVLGGALHHVLWIDEANNLTDLRGMEGGDRTLKQLFDAFIRWTKQEKLATIVLSSSESFYLNDIYKEAFHRIKPFCIGCFSEADARAYYDHLTAEVEAAERLLLPPFEEAYKVVGGHPMHMRELVQRCLKEGLLQRGLIHHEACVQYSYLLDSALGGSRSVGAGVDYTVNQLTHALRLVGRLGFVYTREFRSVMQNAGATDPDAVMRAFVHHNLLHYRPNTEQSYDLPRRITQGNVPVLSAPSPAALYNLRHAIKDGLIV